MYIGVYVRTWAGAHVFEHTHTVASRGGALP